MGASNQSVDRPTIEAVQGALVGAWSAGMPRQHEVTRAIVTSTRSSAAMGTSPDPTQALHPLEKPQWRRDPNMATTAIHRRDVRRKGDRPVNPGFFSKGSFVDAASEVLRSRPVRAIQALMEGGLRVISEAGGDPERRSEHELDEHQDEDMDEDE